jgi:hypothetical protein
VRTFLTNLLGLIRYARPDHNPLRRPIDRVHSRLLTALGVVFLLIVPFAATGTAHLVARGGLRAERVQAKTRHRVDATVLGPASAAPGADLGGATRIMWHDGGTVRTSAVPSGSVERPGAHRTVWVDRAGHLTTQPRRHSQTVAASVVAALTVVVLLSLLHSIACTMVDRRLDRRRLAQWEREWSTVAPRWTGRRP